MASQGNTSKAIFLYTKVYDYCKKDHLFSQFAVELAYELFKLDKKSELLKNDIQFLETTFLKLEPSQKENELNFLIFFVDYFEAHHNYSKAFLYLDKYLKINALENKQKEINSSLINQQNEKELNKKSKNIIEYKTELQRKRSTQIYIVLFLLFIILGIVTYYKLKTAKRNTKILLQQNELEQVRKTAIENELKYQKVNNLNIQLNLDIKKKSELVFLDKLKEIRRKKNNDPEEIIKELQLQIINLIQIDKKNSGKVKDSPKDENTFRTILMQLNKNLSDQELRLCSYFRMNLSTKEISQLEQHLAPSSIRVLKNRIKKKLELGVEDNLNQYLNQLEGKII
jgi:DNA-binding CsgD family transcriptional regulator